MTAVTQFYTIDEVARLLGEYPEMLEAIVSNEDNLSYGKFVNFGNIVSIYTGTDQVITAVINHGIKERRELLFDAQRRHQEWHNVLEYFASDPGDIARVKDKGLM